MNKETREIEREKVKLAAEVKGREETLARLAQLGFSDEDLLRLRAFLETSMRDEANNHAELKEEFFVAIGKYKNIKGLEQECETKINEVKKLTNEKSILSGEIRELETSKGILLDEMDKTITSILQRVKTTGEEAATQVQQQVRGI